MIPCKENFIYFEQLEPQQVQLFPDACDIGIVFETLKQKREAARNLRPLLDFYKSKNSIWGSGGRTWEIKIPFEHPEDEYDKNGVILRVSFSEGERNTFDTFKNKSFITIDIQRAHIPTR